jgi:hypothetical protein
MKKLLVLAFVLAVAVAASFAAAKSTPKAASSGGGDLEGKMAIGASGTTVPGIGIRSWISDTSAIDANIGFNNAKDTSKMSLGGSLNTIIKKAAYSRYMWLVGLQYISDTNKFNGNDLKQTDIIIGLGLGAEYMLQELPELSFSAFLTGLGIDMRNYSIAGQSTSDTVFATDPGIGFAVRYYVK